MNLFVAWKMNTQYLHLYILGYEPFVVWKMNTHNIYVDIS